MSVRIVEDATKDHVTGVPRVVLPQRAIFSRRASRFDQLASGHTAAAYLRLMARVARAQHEIVARRDALPIDAAHREQCRAYGMPVLSAQGHSRAGWRDDLHDLVDALRGAATGPVAAALARLAALDEVSVEALAERVLAGMTVDEDALFAPFIGAALQIYFTRQAAALDAADVQRHDTPAACPVCASRPVASVILTDPAPGLRYAHCALCATEWNIARIRCTACGGEEHVRYLAFDDALAAVTKAETCDDCHSYLKIFNQEKDAQVDPCADDLATLALDVIVDERGYTRSGPNLLFHPGSA